MAQGCCAVRNRSTGLDFDLLAHTIKLLARVPYPALKGVEIILDDLRSHFFSHATEQKRETPSHLHNMIRRRIINWSNVGLPFCYQH